jgi:hypothetical protein
VAEFLVKAVSVTHTNPVKDKRGCWKRGDVVNAMPDGHVWGKKEGLPKFLIVKIPGLDPKSAEAQKYVGPEYDGEPSDDNRITRSRFNFLVDSAPLAIKESLQNTGKVTITLNEAKSILEDKTTGLTEL